MSFASSHRAFASIVITSILFAAGALVFHQRDAGAVPAENDDSPSASDSLPTFSLIQDWEERSRLDAETDAELNPVVTAVERLCRYHGAAFDGQSPLMTNQSPLEWPRVFASETVTPRRLRTEIEALMQANGLAFRPLLILENENTTDSLASAVASGAPALLNVPEAAIVYGYDRRELDPWWWVQHPGSTEIMFESERLATLLFWEDDPVANLAWAVTGIDSTAAGREREKRAAGYDWLRTVMASVRADPARGLQPYPLSVRAFRDRVSAQAELPELAMPVHGSDPLGVRRSRGARSHLVNLLEWLSQTTTDTTESRPLRLALYYYHNAIASLEQLDTLLYDAQPGTVSPERYEANWRNTVRKAQIVRRISELLEWEMQASKEIEAAVASVSGPTKATKTTKKKK